MARPLPHWDASVSELKPFSEITLVVTDIDGTLVARESRNVGSHFQDVQRRLWQYHKNRVILTVATGRTWAGAQPILNSLSIPNGTPVILYNGSVIMTYGDEHLLLRRSIPVVVCNRILQACWLAHAAVRSYTIYDYHHDSVLEPLKEQVRGWGFQEPEPNQMPVHDLPKGQPYDDIVGPSAMLISLQRKGELSDQRLRELLDNEPEVSVTSSGSSVIEVRPAGSNKGVALSFITKHLGIDLLDTIAIGDNDNDAELLAAAGIGIAVSGSSANASVAADYVCKFGAIKGTLQVLKLVKSSRRFYSSSISFSEDTL